MAFQKYLILGIVTLLGLQCPNLSYAQRNIDPEMQRKIDNFITQEFLPGTGGNGLGLAIVQDDGQLLYTTGFGMANQQTGIQNGNKTQFVVGSISKGVTSVLAVKILSETFPELGEAVLDTPIVKLLPNYNFTLIDRFRSEQTNFRDLLAHRLCVEGNEMAVVAGAYEDIDEVTYRLRYNAQSCGFRTSVSYHNQAYSVAGHLAALIINKSYEEALRDLLDDLGMFNSTVVMMSDPDNPVRMPYRAMPHYVLNNEIHLINYGLVKRVGTTQGAGGVCFTPDDATRYIRFHINNGNLDGKQIIPEEVMAWLTKPSNLYTAIDYKKESDDEFVISTPQYGLGLGIGSYDGWKYISHEGFYIPYVSLLSMLPTKKIGVFTSMNMGFAQGSLYALHTFIIDTMIGKSDAAERAIKLLGKLRAEEEAEKKEKVKRFEKLAEERMEIAKNSVQMNAIGNYGNPSLGQLEIMERFNPVWNTTMLYIEYGTWFQGWMYKTFDNVYLIDWTTDVRQDIHVFGLETDLSMVTVQGDKIFLLGNLLFLGEFEKGVSLDKLPPIPWRPDSCGP